MLTDGQTDMMKAVDFYAVCTQRQKTLYTSKAMVVKYMPFGRTHFPLFNHYQVLEIPLMISQMQEKLSAQFMQISSEVCYVAHATEH